MQHGTMLPGLHHLRGLSIGQAGSGEWREYTLYFNGLKMIRNCSRVPRTTQVGATLIGPGPPGPPAPARRPARPARPAAPSGLQRSGQHSSPRHIPRPRRQARAGGWPGQAIEAIPEAVSMVGGSIYWSMLPEGTHLKSHLPHLHRDRAHLPHLHRDRARPACICTGTGLAAATSAPGPGSPLPHLRRYWARRCHIRTGTAQC